MTGKKPKEDILRVAAARFTDDRGITIKKPKRKPRKLRKL